MDGKDNVAVLYLQCGKEFVKMNHIDKHFPYTVWNYNHKVSDVKLSESTSKHFEHHALEVWSVLYINRPFGSKNKNIISYSNGGNVVR